MLQTQVHKNLYRCSFCVNKARLTFYEAQNLGWFWERRVGHWYDYYCPECNKKRLSKG
jgi:hypothetical protein